MVRPLTAECSDCGNEFLLSPRGPIPERCHECRRKPREPEVVEHDDDVVMVGSPVGAVALEPEDDDETLVDLGGGMVVPLSEVIDDDLPLAGATIIAEAVASTALDGETIDVGPSRVVQGAVFDGHNFDEVRATLDDGVLIDPHREGPPRAEVHGPHRDWFVDVAPGDRVYPDGLVVRS